MSGPDPGKDQDPSIDPGRALPETSRALGVLPLVRPVRTYRPLVLATLYAAALYPLTYYPKVSDNVLSRYMTIEAIVEHGTLIVDRTELLRLSRPVDLVRFGAHYYSDKPPVLAALASPIYAVRAWNRLRFTSSFQNLLMANLLLTWLVVGFCSALTLFWLRKMLQAVALPLLVSDLLTLAFGFGSQMLTYGVTFNNHSVAACLIAGAMALTLLERTGRRARFDRFGAGLLVTLAAVIDLPAGCLMLAGLGLIQALRVRSIPWAYALGSLGPLLFHGWLQAKVTGSPLPVEMYPQAFVYPGSFWQTPEGAFQEYGARYWFALELLLGPPGWLTLTPALGFGLVGLVMVLVRRGDPLGPMALVVLGTLAVLLVYYTFVVRRTDFAGQSFGTRHLLAITPGVYLFAAVALSRLRGRLAPSLFVILTGVGAFYAYHGAKDPWMRVEERELIDPSFQVAQKFVVYPWSRTRHKLAVDREKAAGSPGNPAKARP